MLLVDWEIRELSACVDPLIAPFSEAVSGDGVISYGLTHMGYDLRLGDTLLVLKGTFCEVIDPRRFRDPDYRRRVFDEVPPQEDGSFLLPAWSFALGVSLERFRMPGNLKGHCLGKSTLCRCGLICNVTPLEPGWEGHLTLELVNSAPSPLLLFAGQGIAQVEFHRTDAVPETDYSGKKYQNQKGSPMPAAVL